MHHKLLFDNFHELIRLVFSFKKINVRNVHIIPVHGIAEIVSVFVHDKFSTRTCNIRS